MIAPTASIEDLLQPDTLDILGLKSHKKKPQSDQVTDKYHEILKATRFSEISQAIKNKSFVFDENFSPLIHDRFGWLSKIYHSLYSTRNLGLWKMAQAVFQLTSLLQDNGLKSLEDNPYLKANLMKYQIGILTVILDDICDRGKNREMFNVAKEVVQQPFRGITGGMSTINNPVDKKDHGLIYNCKLLIQSIWSHRLICKLVIQSIWSHEPIYIHRFIYIYKLVIQSIWSCEPIYKLIVQDIWSVFSSIVMEAPHFDLFKDELEKTYREWITGFDYSLEVELAKIPSMITIFNIQKENLSFLDQATLSTAEQERKELEFKKLKPDERVKRLALWKRHLKLISPAAATHWAGLIDLLFAPDFSKQEDTYTERDKEICKIAGELFRCTQQMTEIGNWIATWERESSQQDFTSGVFVMARENGWITEYDLKSDPQEIKKKIKSIKPKIEKELWIKWEELRDQSNNLVTEIHTTHPNLFVGYVESFSVITYIQIAATGKI